MPRPPIPREPLDGRAQFTTPPATHSSRLYCQPLPWPPANAPLLAIAALPRTIVPARHRATRNERGWATRTALAAAALTLPRATHFQSPHNPHPQLHLTSSPPPPPSSPPQPAKKKTAASGPSYVSQAKGAIIAIADRTGSSLQAIKVRLEVKKKGVCVVCCIWGVLSVCRAGGRRAGGSCAWGCFVGGCYARGCSACALHVGAVRAVRRALFVWQSM